MDSHVRWSDLGSATHREQWCGIGGRISLGDLEVNSQGEVRRASEAPAEFTPLLDVVLRGTMLSFARKDWGDDMDRFELRVLQDGNTAELSFIASEELRRELAAEGLVVPKPVSNHQSRFALISDSPKRRPDTRRRTKCASARFRRMKYVRNVNSVKALLQTIGFVVAVTLVLEVGQVASQAQGAAQAPVPGRAGGARQTATPPDPTKPVKLEVLEGTTARYKVREQLAGSTSRATRWARPSRNRHDCHHPDGSLDAKQSKLTVDLRTMKSDQQIAMASSRVGPSRQTSFHSSSSCRRVPTACRSHCPRRCRRRRASSSSAT